MNATSAVNGSTNDTRGWVSSPNSRGTSDILWSCLFTIFLCCWTSVYPNIPAATDGKWKRFRDKFELACLGMLGPEFLFALALGQWQSARRSVKRFHSTGFSKWTIRHAFFADMGGFVLKSPSFPNFPLDGEQLHYLISNGYVKYPDIERGTIDEKNKADGLSRAITLIQVIWFTMTSVARLVQHLELTTLELTTLGFIFCMLVTSYCWRHKPCDVELPIVIETETKIADILLKAGDSARVPYRRTPLDFVNRDEWCISLLWAYYIQILRYIRLDFCSRHIKGRPINRIPGVNWPGLTLRGTLLYGLVAEIYSGLFLIPWNFEFPSNSERILWRIAGIVTITFPAVVWPFELYLDRRLSIRKPAPSQQDYKPESADCEALPQRPYLSRRQSGLGKAKAFAARLRNNSQDDDPALDIPLRALIPATILCAAYTIARIYFLVEDLIGLRCVPSKLFENVDWMQLIPHI